MTWKQAEKDALTFAQAEKEFADHFHDVNTRQQGRKPSRAEQYWSALSRPRPAFHRMTQLGVEHILDDVTINHWGFQFKDRPYELHLSEAGDNSDLYGLLLDAATS